MVFGSFKGSYDWDISLNESTMDSISDYDVDPDPENNKMYENNLKQQIMTRKSKKVCFLSD